MELTPEGAGHNRPLRIAPKESNRPDLDIDLDALAWQDAANCNGSDPEIFFPKKGERNTKAKAICAACHVIEICQDYAIAHPELAEGVWGGLTHDDRESIRVERRQLRKQEERKTQIARKAS